MPLFAATYAVVLGLGLDVAIDQIVVDGLASAVPRLSAAGLRIVSRDPVWPSGATEEAIMPLQHAGLAALYGNAFLSDPAAFDVDIAQQIERGLSWTSVVGRVAASQIASASVLSSFCRLTYGFTYAGGINRTVCPNAAAACVEACMTLLESARQGK